MTYWKQIAEMLGVELGEEFKVENKGGIFRITDNGLTDEEDDVWDDILSGILSGKVEIIKKPWIPEYGEDYWFVETDGSIDVPDWRDTAMDLAMYKCGWIFKTEAEAMKDRDRVLAEYEQVKKEETAS